MVAETRDTIYGGSHTHRLRTTTLSQTALNPIRASISIHRQGNRRRRGIIISHRHIHISNSHSLIIRIIRNRSMRDIQCAPVIRIINIVVNTNHGHRLSHIPRRSPTRSKRQRLRRRTLSTAIATIHNNRTRSTRRHSNRHIMSGWRG